MRGTAKGRGRGADRFYFAFTFDIGSVPEDIVYGELSAHRRV